MLKDGGDMIDVLRREEEERKFVVRERRRWT
jgi:hypothetical protein